MAALAAAVAFAISAAALAGSPLKGGFLGGGSIETKFRQGFHPKLAWINLAVSKDGKTVTAYGDWNASCSGFAAPARASFVAKAIQPRADGSFVAVGDLSGPHTAGHYALTGKFTTPTSATGTGQSQFTFAAPDGKEYDCDTGNLKWQARDDAHSPSGGKAALKPNAVYYGNVRGSTGRLPFLLRLDATGTTIEEATALVDARCTKDTSYYVHVDPIFARVQVGAGGTFTSRPSYTDSLAGKTSDQEGRVTMIVFGRFGKSTVAGTWRVDVKIVQRSTGALVDSCTSGAMTFKAAR